jgi:hypothetical protein
LGVRVDRREKSGNYRVIDMDLSLTPDVVGIPRTFLYGKMKWEMILAKVKYPR